METPGGVMSCDAMRWGSVPGCVVTGREQCVAARGEPAGVLMVRA